MSLLPFELSSRKLPIVAFIVTKVLSYFFENVVIFKFSSTLSLAELIFIIVPVFQPATLQKELFRARFFEYF